MATNSYFARPDEDLCTQPPTVVASAEDTDYPAANLISANAAKPAKLTATSGNWVLDFGAAVAPVAAILVYHYLDAALAVSIQGNAADAWGAPSYSTAITIPAKRKDGPSTQRWTNNAYLLIAGSPSYRYWRLNVSGVNSQNVAVGRFMLLSAYHLVRLAMTSGLDEGDSEGEIVQPTELGVETVYTLGGPRRSLGGVALATESVSSSAELASGLRALYESAEGRATPFAFFPFGTSAEPWLVRFESAEAKRKRGQGDLQEWTFSVREVSRGLPWP